MGEVHSIQIQEPPAQKPLGGEPPEPEVKPESQETENQQPEKPEWLQDKYLTEGRSVEDAIQEQAKAYTEAQKKLSERQGIEKPETPTEGNISETVHAARTEFYENDGQLSEDTYKALEAGGMPKEVVDAFIEGQKAQAELYNMQLQQIGGEDHKTALEWGGDNLTEAEIAAFNSEYTSGDLTRATVAMKGLLAQYQLANGRPSKLLQGETSGLAGVQPYSKAEMMAAMKDPRYKNGDKNFHAEVQKRLAVTNAQHLS